MKKVLVFVALAFALAAALETGPEVAMTVSQVTCAGSERCRRLDVYVEVGKSFLAGRAFRSTSGS